MNLLIIDPDKMGLDLAYRAGLAGHSVKWFQPPDKRGAKALDGIGFEEFEKVDSWLQWMKWAKSGLIVNLFNTKYVRELDEWKKHGFPVFSPSVKSAALEIKRGLGMQAFEEVGIDVPEFRTFSTLQEAATFARKQTRGYVFKTLGDEEDKSLSYVARDPADLAARLDYWQKTGLRLKGPCLLQEKVEGIEVGVSAWCGPAGFLPNKWNENFEFKKLMPGDYGQNTGEQGSVLQYVTESKLAEQILAPLEELLVKLGHIGDVDINAIVPSSGKPKVLEFTCRFGYPSTFIQIASHKGDPVQWMKDLLAGHDTLKVSNDVAIGVVLAQPPYPYPDDKPEKTQGIPIYGLSNVLYQAHMVAVMKGRAPVMKDGKVTDETTFLTTASYLMCVTALGKTVRGAMAKAYGAVEQIKVPNLIVRDDIGERLERQLPDLHRAGYCKFTDYGGAP